MASLTPSEYRLKQREDGGPFIYVDKALSLDDEDEDSAPMMEVLAGFSDIEPAKVAPTDITTILAVREDLIKIYPINVRPDKPGYLQPKYGSLTCIVVNPRINRPYPLPNNEDEVEELLQGLPTGFSKNFRFGLGLLWEYRNIAETVAELKDISTLWIVGGDAPPDYAPPVYTMSIGHFQSLRKEIDRISGKSQRSAKQEKDALLHNSILYPARPKDFPRKERKLRSGELTELRGSRRNPITLSKTDQRAVLDIVSDNVAQIANTEPQSLMRLKGDIELVTLSQLIGRFEEMLTKNLTEPKWQSFFAENPFILSLTFSVPFMLVQSQAYAGGKRLGGTGGKYPDFIYAAASTGNLAIVEIKKPSASLLHTSSYRGDDVFPLSTDLNGAVSQVLNQRATLQRSLATLKEDDPSLVHLHGFSTKCIVLSGRNPTQHSHKKSFELARNAMGDVTIMTFDELLTRLQTMQKALSPPPPPEFSAPDSPF